MARVTVEDCIDKVDSPYELVLVAKERATQLNAGLEPTLERDDDKNTVIALREIAVENIKVSDLEETAIYKLRKHVEPIEDNSEEDDEIGDDFQNLYKGEISKSGTPILPSKRARKIPDKIQILKEDLDELKKSSEPASLDKPAESESEDTNISIESLKEEEDQENSDTKEDQENSDTKEDQENSDTKEDQENSDTKEDQENSDTKEDTEAINS